MIRGSTGESAADEHFAAWRIERLCAAGFDTSLARTVAGDRSYDLHALLELIDRGCPPELAARILAPIDETVSPLTVSP